MGTSNVLHSSQAGQLFGGTKRTRAGLPKGQATEQKQVGMGTSDHVDLSASRPQHNLTGQGPSFKGPLPAPKGQPTGIQTQSTLRRVGSAPSELALLKKQVQPNQATDTHQVANANQEQPKEEVTRQNTSSPQQQPTGPQAEVKGPAPTDTKNVDPDGQGQGHDQGTGDGQGGGSEGHSQGSGDNASNAAQVQGTTDETAPDAASPDAASKVRTGKSRDDQDGKSDWIKSQRPPLHSNYEAVGYGDLEDRVRMKKSSRSGEYTLEYTSPDKQEKREYTITIGDPGNLENKPEHLACYLGMLVELAYTKDKDFQSAMFYQKPQDGVVTAKQTGLVTDDTGRKKAAPQDWKIQEPVPIPTAPEQKASVKYEDELKAILEGIAMLLGQKQQQQYTQVRQSQHKK